MEHQTLFLRNLKSRKNNLKLKYNEIIFFKYTTNFLLKCNIFFSIKKFDIELFFQSKTRALYSLKYGISQSVTCCKEHTFIVSSMNRWLWKRPRNNIRKGVQWYWWSYDFCGFSEFEALIYSVYDDGGFPKAAREKF